MYQISREKMPELLAAVAKEMDLFLPVQNNGITNFGFWTEDAKVDLDTLKTVKSPKDAFFPQSEVLYSCYQKANKTSIEPAALKDAPFAIFGVRPCDVRAFDVLDRVFLSEPADVYYAARREHGIVVSLACHEPEDSCFCKTFGIDAAEPQADVAMWQVADGYAWEAKTEKGEKLTELVKEYLTEQDLAKEVEAEKEAIRTLIDKMPNSNLSLEGWGVGKTKERFDDPKWKELSDACLGCGTCTFSCPTCQCYDIKDFNTGNGVQRYRCWDSCMYSDFTMMAAGNNRTTQMQRFRQRFMHKLVYFPDNNDGMYSCVGCGRCVEKCPQSLNIVKVIKRMGGTKEMCNCSCGSEEKKNALLPQVGIITDIRRETPDVKTFRIVRPDGTKLFEHMPGQCAMLCVPGVGEALFSITSSPTNKEYQEFSIKECGTLTNYLHNMSVGDEILVRGPYGNHFPVETVLKGQDLLFIAGGIGLAPLRSVINYVLDNRDNYGTVDIVYGSRSKDDLVQLKEIQEVWAKAKDVNVHLTIDREQEGWDGHVGFVPNYVKELNMSVDKTALICGPPIMIKFVLQGLQELGYEKTQVYTTLELRMKCGIGKCGRCNIGDKYVCKDGPVFRCDEIDELPNEY